MIRRLLLVRHGVTTWNREGRFQGHLDPPLHPLGEVEARAVAERIAREYREPMLLASSPLRRAAATASIIADELATDGRPVELRLEPGLMEIGQGEWEGHTHAELAVSDAERYRTWAATSGWLEPPGGEPASAAGDRAARAVNVLLTMMGGDAADTLCCVSHGGILRLLAGRLASMADADAWRLDVDNASLSVLERAGDVWRIVAWNDVSHLAPELPAEDREAEGSPRAL